MIGYQSIAEVLALSEVVRAPSKPGLDNCICYTTFFAVT